MVARAVAGRENSMGVTEGRAERGRGVGEPRGILLAARERRSQSLRREVGVPCEPRSQRANWHSSREKETHVHARVLSVESRLAVLKDDDCASEPRSAVAPSPPGKRKDSR